MFLTKLENQYTNTTAQNNYLKLPKKKQNIEER